MLFVALLAWSGVASAQHWLPVPKPPGPFNAGGVALQLTDGTIMVQEYGSPNWYQLTPDEHANYTNGTWTKLASSLVSDGESGYVTYAPQDVASAVLPDGRVIVEGGEYNWVGGQYNSVGNWVPGVTKKVWTNLGAIFDLTKGATGQGLWTRVYPPKGWAKIGDAPSVVLPNGTFMLGQCCLKPPQKPEAALLDVDGTTLSWTVLTSTNGYKGKYDSNNEEGWTLLPNGNVLTVDTYVNAKGKGVEGAKGTLPNNSEIYNPLTGTWTSAGNTVEPLSNLQVICDPPVKGGHEVGPGILRPDGTVFVTGVYSCKGALFGPTSEGGHTAIYYPNPAGEGGFWKAGPDIPCNPGFFPACNDMADAPAALLQDGNVLVQTSPGINTGPSTFYEFDLKTNTFLSGIPTPPNFSESSSEPGRMLVVASGHVFYMHLGASTDEMGFYVPNGTYDPLWLCPHPRLLHHGRGHGILQYCYRQVRRHSQH